MSRPNPGEAARDRRKPVRSLLLGLTGLGIEGGIASVNRCILRALEESVEGGDLDRVDRVLLESGDAHPVDPPHSGIERCAGGSQPRFVLEAWRTAALRRPDLVFFDHAGLAQAGTLPLPGLHGRRQVIFVHGSELVVAHHGRRAEALRKAFRILVNSDFTARLVTDLDPALAPKVRVVTLCIDPARIEGWRRLALGNDTPERAPAALIVGRMAAEERGKGHEDLIAAWPRVLRSVPEAELWVAGGGDDRSRLEQCAREAGVSEAVRFLGRLSEEELHDRMRRASVLAMPSRQEGFGLVYAEAAWHGTPGLGSVADAAGCVIRDEETGFLVPYGDREAIASSLVRLLRDPELVRKMGEAGRADVEERFLFPRFRRDLLAALELGGA